MDSSDRRLVVYHIGLVLPNMASRCWTGATFNFFDLLRFPCEFALHSSIRSPVPFILLMLLMVVAIVLILDVSIQQQLESSLFPAATGVIVVGDADNNLHPTTVRLTIERFTNRTVQRAILVRGFFRIICILVTRMLAFFHAESIILFMSNESFCESGF